MENEHHHLIGTGINGTDSSPSHSFGTSSGYSSSVDYYNTPVLTSKTGVNNANILNTNTSNNSIIHQQIIQVVIVHMMVHQQQVHHHHLIQQVI